MSNFQSDLLRLLDERGYIHQQTDAAGLDALAQKQVIPGYIGFDATAPSLHIGSLVQIMMLRRLQQAGHKPIVVMGGGTTKIGDPSGKDESRKLLTSELIDENIAGIRTVFERLLTFGDGPTDAVMVNNDEWLGTLGYIELLRDVGPQPPRQPVGAHGGLPGKGQGAGSKVQRRKLKTPVGEPAPIGDKAGLVAEEVVVGGFEQRADVARKIQMNPLTRGQIAARRPKSDLPRQSRRAVRRKRDVGGEIIDRTRPVQGKLDRGLSGKTGKARDDPALAFCRQKVDGRPPGRVGIAGHQREIARRPLTCSPRAELCFALPVRKLRRALCPEFDRFAQDAGAQRDAIGAQHADAQRNRQFWQCERSPAARRVICGPCGRGLALHHDLFGRHLVDLDPARQQGRAVPRNRAFADRQPDARVIGDAELREGCP